MKHPLTPSLWRTCRVLANPRRLELFQAMLHHHPQTVSELSVACAQPLSTCSQYLRMLQARGLCRAIRDGTWVRYALHADPSVMGSAELLDALKTELAVEDVRLDAIHFSATACTHPRRIAMLAVLSTQGPLSIDDLRSQTRISSAALFRHLEKLLARNFIRWHGGTVELGSPPGPFARTLLALAASTPP